MKDAPTDTTEDLREGGYFPEGIDFSAIRPVAATVSQSLDDHAAILELLDDE